MEAVQDELLVDVSGGGAGGDSLGDSVGDDQEDNPTGHGRGSWKVPRR